MPDHFATWHVHFDGAPAVVGHVCPFVAAIGQSLGCPQGHPLTAGDCEHVQLRRCTCSSPELCDVDHVALTAQMKGVL